MSLTMSLNTALSGLKVNRESLAVLSQNIANANNPNYSRKIISQSTITLDGVGSGVSIEDITRKIDTFLQLAVRDQTSVAGRAGALTDYAERLQILLGSPGAGNGLNSFITNMFNAMQSLAETPERSSNRVNVLNAAQSLVDEVGQIFDGIQDLRFDADQEIKSAVTTVNLQLNELFNLNTAISNATVLNRPKSELLDKRDAAIREIAEFLDINVYEKPDETVHLYVTGGASLLDANLYELEYNPISSPDTLLADDPQFSPIRTYILNSDGERVSESISIITGGSSSEVTTGMNQGKIKALIDIRDDKMPQILEQLDMLVSKIRDEVNAVHNIGSGYPGSNKLTGTRPVTAGTFSNWTGKVRIGIVDVNGQPIQSPYASETSAIRPLTIDLSALNAGQGNGAGYPDVQSIVNEINHYYAIPRNKTSLGDFNNIQLASATTTLPGGSLSFDFDLENISGNDDAKFFVTSVSILDDTAADITSVTNTVPKITLNSTTTYSATSGSKNVVIAADSHGLANGDYIFLPTPSAAVGGIPAAQLGGMFQVSSVTTNGFTITATSAATSTATRNETGTAFPKYHEVDSGSQERTSAQGQFIADLVGNISSSYYDVRASVSVVDSDGTVSSSVITYRVSSNDGNLYNKRYGAISATGAATLETATQRTQPYVRARLVDANGTEISTINNRYIADVTGFLELEVNDTAHYLSIDSLDSLENGNPSGNPLVLPGSERGFSHYFELNNFFTSNSPTTTGDTLANSARNFAVESRIATSPANISTGRLVQSPAPADPTAAPLYSYERISGDDNIIQQLADLADGLVTFDQAGGLSASNQTLSGYAGEILGFAGSDANSMESNFQSVQIILEGFTERSNAVSGVNLDEELANTVIYQNAYSASARVITVANELFETLLNSF